MCAGTLGVKIKGDICKSAADIYFSRFRPLANDVKARGDVACIHAYTLQVVNLNGQVVSSGNYFRYAGKVSHGEGDVIAHTVSDILRIGVAVAV